MLGHTAALARAAAAGGGPSRRTLVALSACAAAGALAGVECLKQGGRFSPMPLTGARPRRRLRRTTRRSST